MSCYDGLDPRTELEQKLTADLKLALEKRGFTVIHNGTVDTHAPAGKPDIEVSNSDYIITVEGTKSKGAQQDREYNSIRDHLMEIKASNGEKQCFCVFVSSETARRMLDSIRDHNLQRASEDKEDLKIMPLCFESLELWATRLRENEAELYPAGNFLKLFDSYPEFIDDLRIRKLLLQTIFPEDASLAQALSIDETERDQWILESLIKDLDRMENYMRENGIAVGRDTIDTLIHLVFIKLYEEKRERRGETNRLLSIDTFKRYRQDAVDAATRRRKRAIHKLFNNVKEDEEFSESGMFTEDDKLPAAVTDDFILDYFIPQICSKYDFVGTRVDALGAVYEILAKRAEKDIRIGQFFTPENVVQFMVRLADLQHNDMVLDPACGTGRFLIHAMNDMLPKVQKSGVRDQADELKKVREHRLFGVDRDDRIAKIAKMNMWIHGDGKSNIFGGPEYNGLTLHQHAFDEHDSFDNEFDVVLTNPPLGDLNYQNTEFVRDIDDEQQGIRETLERMPILPHKNLTKEELDIVNERLELHRQDLKDLEQQVAVAEATECIKEWQKLGKGTEGKEERRRKHELKENNEVREYEHIRSRIKSKLKIIEQGEATKTHLDGLLSTGQVEWEITGNKLKGGALFLAAIWHYLKNEAYRDTYPEWRGGKVLTILDEGILNTDEYIQIRDFIRSHFYIKAIISLTRDTFVPISKTSTKTSIFYAVKKTDLNAIQKEPIYFAHVARVGQDTRGKVCPNDLEAVLQKYSEFIRKVRASFVGAEFRKERFEATGFEKGIL